MIKQSLDPGIAKRKLASVQLIESVNPIPDADAIEVAQILNWKVVVRKGEFKVGDRIVYFEIDSFLPASNMYSFVGDERVNPITLNTAHEDRGYRLATAVLRKQVSQGLALKFTELDSTYSGMSREELIEFLEGAEIGTDVTSLLGVTKFDRPEIAHELGLIVGTFPTQFTPQTDEERVQTKPRSYDKIFGQPYYISSKVDGTSITAIKAGDKLICATRNNTLGENNVIEKMLIKSGVKEKLDNFNGDLVFQSELYGTGIAKNHLGIQDKRLATFTLRNDETVLGLERILDVVGELGLEIPEIVELGSNDEEQIARILLKVEQINSTRPQVDPTRSTEGPLPIVIQKVVTQNFHYSIDEIIERMNNTTYSTSGRQQEGGVIRPLADTQGRHPVSFKVINNKFLLKNK